MKLVMRNSHLALMLGVWLALAACSKPTQQKAGEDLKAVGADTTAAAKAVAGSGAVKNLGSDIKEGAGEAADTVSKYLIERAEQYQPVVEMPTGIEVEIVFLDGVHVRSNTK